MFIGHFGAGLAAKAVDHKISLGFLFIAAQFIDLLWPTLLLLDMEHVEIRPGITNVAPLDFVDYPISHSLLMVLIWGLLAGLLFFLIKRNKKGAILIGLLVLSHWFLDLVVHRPDLPLAPGASSKLGLGLWYSFEGSLILETILLLTGIFIYMKKTKAKNKVGKYGAWSLFVFLYLVHLGNLFGPVPAHVHDIAWGAQLQWIFVVMAFWVDKNREVTDVKMPQVRVVANE